MSNEVTAFDDSLRMLVSDMFDTLNVELGAGIAASQIGVQKRVILVKCDSFDHKNDDPYEKDPNVLVAVNPVLELSDERCTWQEACLSVPLIKGTVSRSRYARIEYQDVCGNKRELKAEWPLSGALQHECDHLDGILFLNRMPRKNRFTMLESKNKEKQGTKKVWKT
jgi:peptide deformylase